MQGRIIIRGDCLEGVVHWRKAKRSSLSDFRRKECPNWRIKKWYQRVLEWNQGSEGIEPSNIDETSTWVLARDIEDKEFQGSMKKKES